METAPDDALLMSESMDVNNPSQAIREEHRYLLRDGKHLFCADYVPVSGATSGIVLCAPFAEEKIRTLRVYVSLARAMACRGVAATCFDYYGDGDSEGDFEEAVYGDRLEDIASVFHDFRQRYSLSRVGVFGLRWGGTLAALAAENLRPAALLLWEPIVDTSKYFFEHLRSSIVSQMLIDGKISQKREVLVASLEAGQTITVEGYNLNGDFFCQARANGLKDLRPAYSGPVLIVQLSGNPGRLSSELESLGASYAHSRVLAFKREFEWEKTETWRPAPPALFAATLEFLKTHEFC